MANKLAEDPTTLPEGDGPMEELNKLNEEPLIESDLPPGMQILDDPDTSNEDKADALPEEAKVSEDQGVDKFLGGEVGDDILPTMGGDQTDNEKD